MYINVNDEKLLKNSQNIKNDYLEEYNSCINKIEENIENIGKAWKGNDYDNFYNKMTEVIVDLNSLKKYINSCNNFVEKYANIIQKIDEKYQNRKIDIK